MAIDLLKCCFGMAEMKTNAVESLNLQFEKKELKNSNRKTERTKRFYLVFVFECETNVKLLRFMLMLNSKRP